MHLRHPEIWLLIALLAVACVPHSAATVRSTVEARIGHRVLLERGGQVESGSVRELLSRPVGPDEATRVALLHNPRAQLALEELGVSQAGLLGDSVLPNPQIDSELRLGREGGGGDELEAHVVMDLAEVITLPLRRAAAEAELEAAQLRAARELLALAYRARTTFVRYQAAQELLHLSLSIAQTTRASYETARALYDAGNVPAIDAVLEESLYEESRLELAQAELEVLERREELQVLLGLSGAETTWEPSPEGLATLPGEDPSLEELEPRMIERSLALGEGQQRLLALARRHGVARTQGIVPELRAGISTSFADQVWAFGPALSITLPIFDQGLARADRIEAELLVEQQRYVATAIELRSMVRRARNRLVNARARAEFVRGTLIPVRERALQETLLQYNAMAATPFQLLQVRRDQIEAVRMDIEARRDYWLARAALEQFLAGGSLTADGPGEDDSTVSPTVRHEVH